MLIDKLNSPGGHILVLLAIVVIAVLMAAFHIHGAEELAAGAVGGLLYAMQIPSKNKPTQE